MDEKTHKWFQPELLFIFRNYNSNVVLMDFLDKGLYWTLFLHFKAWLAVEYSSTNMCMVKDRNHQYTVVLSACPMWVLLHLEGNVCTVYVSTIVY